MAETKHGYQSILTVPFSISKVAYTLRPPKATHYAAVSNYFLLVRQWTKNKVYGLYFLSFRFLQLYGVTSTHWPMN